MNEPDDDLESAFSAAYTDFCLSNGHPFDPQIFTALYLEFLRDMQNGFASLFGGNVP